MVFVFLVDTFCVGSVICAIGCVVVVGAVDVCCGSIDVNDYIALSQQHVKATPAGPAPETPTLQETLDEMFGPGGFRQMGCMVPDDDAFCWDADSTTTIENFTEVKDAKGQRRLLQRNDSCISVSSATPEVCEKMATLCSDVGDPGNGSVLPDVQGVAIKLGFEVLVRMAIRTILALPLEYAVTVVKKYEGRGVEHISTTFSCSDAPMEAKCAISAASKMLLGEMDDPGSQCQYELDQCVAAECEQFKVDYLVHKERPPWHKLRAVTKDHGSMQWHVRRHSRCNNAVCVCL